MSRMTDLFASGVLRVCRQRWAPLNYLQLTAITGGIGPWASLFFPPAGLEEFACPYTLCVLGDMGEDWVAYEGEEVAPRAGLPLDGGSDAV